MINFNGTLLDSSTNVLHQNRGILYGDGVFETLKIVEGKILFFEDHYFRLMAAMRIVRMEIPMTFTLEYLEEQVVALAKSNKCEQSARVRITVYRNDGGFYLPTNNSVSFFIQVTALDHSVYSIDEKPYEVDLYKDFYIAKQLLSTLKTTNKMIHITGSIYANENDLDNCILLNDSKNVVEALQGNLFMRMGNALITPPLTEGCLNGIMRKQILSLAKKETDLEVIEQVISPFDLQKADELFITNVIRGIQPITKYRKKEFTNDTAKVLNEILKQHLAMN